MAERLAAIAARLCASGKGILAADESSATIRKRFDVINLVSTEESRRDYREMLFRAEEAMTRYISGVILYDETIHQTARDGTPLTRIIEAAGSIPGIKVDHGAKPLALAPGEVVTEGLDGLRKRLHDYHDLGARFAKWRAVIDIAPGIPTTGGIHANAHALARFAALCQEANVVPIVEPEVLMDGAVATHGIDTCYAVTERVLAAVFEELALANVSLPGLILKPNMIIAGQKSPKQASAEEVAEKTVKLLKARVPAEVAGVAFLSGGQSDVAATEHLSLMNAIGGMPWPLTHSYGRALQAAAIQAWGGTPAGVPAGQAAFSHRARMNGLASRGVWTAAAEKEAA